MEITATEFKKNLGKYLGAVSREDVVITKNGKAVARLVGERAYLAGAAELDKLLMLRETPATDFYDPGVKPGAAPGAARSRTAGSGTRDAVGAVNAPDTGSGAAVSAVADVATTMDAALDVDKWLITRDGEPIARITPIPKKKKRILGFFKGPEATPKEEAALLESEWTEEIEKEWLSKL
jgi:prevent-host-death family protein